MTKAYKDFRITRVSSVLYCNSHGQYFVSVHFINNKNERGGDYQLGGGIIDYVTLHKSRRRTVKHHQHVIPPKQATDYIYAELRRAIEAGALKVYECDRDGNRRYEDYRYHSLNHLKSLLDVEGTPCACSAKRTISHEETKYGILRRWVECTQCYEHWLEKKWVGVVEDAQITE